MGFFGWCGIAVSWAGPTIEFNPEKVPEKAPIPMELVQVGTPVPEHAERRLGAPVLAHRQGIIAVAVSPDHRTFASIGRYEGGIALWDLETGARLARLDRLGVQAQAVAFSPDGGQVAVVDTRGVAVWSVGDRKAIDYLGEVGDGLRSVAWSKDGKILYLGDDLGTIHRVDLGARTLSQWVGPEDTAFTEIAVSPDGNKIAASGIGGSVWVWNAEGAPVLQAKGNREGTEGLAFSSDGSQLFVGLGADPAITTGRLKIWDLRRGISKKVVLDAPVVHVAGSVDRVVVALADGQVVSLNPLSGQPSESVRPRTLPVVLAVDEERVIAGADNGKILAFGRLTGKAWFEPSGPQAALTDVAWMPDGSRIAATSADGSVTLWDATTGEQKRALFGHEQGALQLAFSPNGQRLLTSAADGSYRLWNVEAGAVFKYWGDGFEGQALAWNADGSAIAIGGAEGKVVVLSAADYSELTSYQHPAHVEGLEFSPTGDRLAVAMRDNVLGVWTQSTQSVAFQRKIEAFGVHVHSVAWSDDGQRVATAGESGQIALWSADSEQPTFLTSGDEGWGAIPVLGLDWAGDRLVSASADGSIAVWRGDGTRLARWRGHEGAATGIAISPKGEKLASAGEDGTVIVWTMP